MSGYAFKVEDKTSKLMSFRIDHVFPYKAIWTRIEDLKNVTLNTLPVYDDTYIETKMRAIKFILTFMA